MSEQPKKVKSGKGSGRRKEDPKKVRSNWDNIAGFKPSKFK